MRGIFTVRWDVGATGRSAVPLQQLEQKVRTILFIVRATKPINYKIDQWILT